MMCLVTFFLRNNSQLFCFTNRSMLKDYLCLCVGTSIPDWS